MWVKNQIGRFVSAIHDIAYHLDGTDLVLKGRANATGRAKIHLKKGGRERGLFLRGFKSRMTGDGCNLSGKGLSEWG